MIDKQATSIFALNSPGLPGIFQRQKKRGTQRVPRLTLKTSIGALIPDSTI